MIMDKYEGTKKVSMSNEIIESSFFHRPELDLTVNQFKLVMLVASKINKETQAFVDTEIPVREYCNLFGINYEGGRNKKDIKTSLTQIAKKMFWYKLEDGSEELVRWMDRINLNTKTGIITFRLSDSLKTYLLDLKGKFISFQLGYTMEFTSKYSFPFYLFARRLMFVKTKTVYIKTIRNVLLRDDEKTKYPRYFDFYKRCLKPAMDDINEFSDIMIDCTPYKEGREIVAVQFYIRPKTKEEMEKVDAWKLLKSKTQTERLKEHLDKTYALDRQYYDMVEEEEMEFAAVCETNVVGQE